MYENSNSLKTENSFWQYYPAFWVFRKTKILVPTKKKKKQKNVSPCAPARAHGEQCQVIKPRSRTQYSEHRLSLLFPKLRLSNFMISSLVTSAVFVQCPNVCTNWVGRQTQPPLCRCPALPNPSLCPSGQWPARQKRRPAEAKVYDLKSSIYGPGLSLIDHQPCRLFEADKLLFIIISFSSSLNWKNVQIHSLYQTTSTSRAFWQYSQR